MLRLRQFINVSFQAKVLIPVIVVMVSLLAVTVTVVNLRFQQQMVDNGRNELKAASVRFQHALVMHQDKLRLCFKILANEPKYRAAFMNIPFDPATVRDSLCRMVEDEKLAEENLDFVFFTRGDAAPKETFDPMIQQLNTMVSVRAIMVGCDRAVRLAQQGDPQPDTIRIGNKLYNVISIPVFFPRKSDGVVGVLTFGEELNWQSAQELSMCASGLTALIADDEVVASTLAGNEPTEHLAGRFKKLTAPAARADATLAIRRIIIGSEHYFCSAGTFASLKGDASLGYLLFSSYEKQLQALQQTRVLLTAVSLVTILISSVAVWMLVRKATEPLRELRDSAEAVGRGDFTRRVPVRSSDECGELAKVFNQMTGNLEQSRTQLEQTVETLKSTQGQLIQSEKLSAVGEFVAGVAHELNNPLAAVVGFSEMLKDNDVDTKNRRYLDMIYKSAQRCQKIVQALLSFARRHQPERKPMSVNPMVEAVLEMVNYQLRTSNIEVITQLTPSAPVVLADGHQIQQVLLNVINNARQAMDSRQTGGRIQITTQALDENVQIIIHDNGPGITQENLRRIFDPFFTTKGIGQGTGLGLSLCYGIIKEHGGNIKPSSSPGDGAKFVIELPAFHVTSAMIEPLPAFEPKPKDATEGIGKKILVIDDEEAILQMLRESLAGNGYAVDTVSDGEQALRLLRENRYDVTFCDWKMPGLNGRQVYERLQATNPAFCRRVIFFSGDVVSGHMREFLEREKRPCLAKPFGFHEVRAAIADVLKS